MVENISKSVTLNSSSQKLPFFIQNRKEAPDLEQEYTNFLRLMGAFLREEAPHFPEEPDWKAQLELARVHSLSGILGYMVTEYDLCPSLTPVARNLCMSTISAFTQRDALTRRFSQSLSRQGIDHILMKGYVVKDCYPIPQLRTYGDIDLVIRQEDREKCHAFLVQQGFQVKTDWEPVYAYTRGQEFYEIHTQLLDADIPGNVWVRQWFSHPWENASVSGEHVYQFSNEYHFLYLLAHLAKHITGSGAGLRLYMDIALYLRRFGDSMDWGIIRRGLGDMQLTTFADSILCFIERYFGIKSPLKANTSEEVLEELANVTLSGGVFGREGQSSGTLTMKTQSPDATPGGALLRRLFPSAKTIESRYTYLQKRPWLLPVAWIHRLIRTRKDFRSHRLEAVSLWQADKSQVQQAQRLNRDIGLTASDSSRTRILPPEVLLESYRDILREEAKVDALPLVVTGTSMTPFLIPRRDTVFLSRVDRPLRRGDVVLYRRNSGSYVLHRIYRISPQGMTMIGDGQTALEPGIRQEQVIARMTRVIRKGKTLGPGSFWWWFFEKIWLRIIPLRPGICRIYAFFYRIFHP